MTRSTIGTTPHLRFRLATEHQRRSDMNRLPAKAKSPIRIDSLADQSRSNHGAAPGAPWRDHEQRHMPSSQQVSPMLRLLRFPDVHERTGLSRSTIWRLEQQGLFPRHHRISANAVAWVEAEVLYWIRTKVGEVAV
ncbi:MAG: helix-turn-helix transcriptional regulator [Vicinamibacterales bacterium]